MITSNTKTSAVVVTAPRPLTKEQRETVRVEVASNLPANVGVIVLDPGFAIAPVGDASILAELGALRTLVAAFRDDVDSIANGTARTRAFLMPEQTEVIRHHGSITPPFTNAEAASRLGAKCDGSAGAGVDVYGMPLNT